MKTIIAGGRDYQLTAADMEYLSTLPITQVISGCARGADAGGESFAAMNNLPVLRFPADWDTYGNKAGPIRNRQMAEVGEMLVAFPGGAGTANMVLEAKRLGLVVHDRRTQAKDANEPRFWGF